MNGLTGHKNGWSTGHIKSRNLGTISSNFLSNYVDFHEKFNENKILSQFDTTFAKQRTKRLLIINFVIFGHLYKIVVIVYERFEKTAVKPTIHSPKDRSTDHS